jgi:hypothetical protein
MDSNLTTTSAEDQIIVLTMSHVIPKGDF